MPRITRWTALTCIAGFALAACSSSGGKALTKADFVKQANAICAKGNKDSDALGKTLPKNPTAQQVADLYISKAVPQLNAELDDIAALNPPKEDADTVKSFLDDARSEAKAFADKLKSDPKGTLSSTDDPLKHSEDEATAYGLTVCGSS